MTAMPDLVIEDACNAARARRVLTSLNADARAYLRMMRRTSGRYPCWLQAERATAIADMIACQDDVQGWIDDAIVNEKTPDHDAALLSHLSTNNTQAAGALIFRCLLRHYEQLMIDVVDQL